MTTLKKMSITIDGTEINGVDNRRLHGQIADTRNPQAGFREVLINGIIEGVTASGLDAKIAAAKAACITIDKRVVIKVDGTLGTNFADIYQGDGTTVTLQTSISQDPTRVAAATSWPFLLSVFVSEVVPSVSGSGAGVGVVAAGQVGAYKLTTMYDEGNTISKSLLISFAELTIRDALGTRAFTSVEDDGGFARFVFASLPVGTPNIVYIAGGTQYDGPHDITDYDQSGGKITTDVVFAGTAAGTAEIGTEQTPEELYTAAKATLFALIGTAADGKRDATSGLAKSGESVATERDVMTVFLSSEWIEKDYGDAIRGWQIRFEESEMEDWSADSNAGDPPKYTAAFVSFTVDRILTAETPKAVWLSIRDTVLTDAKAAIGGGAVGPLVENIGYNRKTNSVLVTMKFVSDNTDVLLFSRTMSITTKLDFIEIGKDPEGYSLLQSGPEPIEKFIAVTITRVAVSDVDLANLLTTPKENGYTYIDISDSLDVGQPMRKKEFGTYSSITVTRVYQRFKLKSGSAPIRIRNPITQ